MFTFRDLKAGLFNFLPQIAIALCCIAAVGVLKNRLLVSAHLFYITQVRDIIFKEYFISVKLLHYFMVKIFPVIDHAKEAFDFASIQFILLKIVQYCFERSY